MGTANPADDLLTTRRKIYCERHKGTDAIGRRIAISGRGHLRYSRAKYFEKSRSTSRCSSSASSFLSRVIQTRGAARYRDKQRRDGGMLVENEENELGRGATIVRMGSPEESRLRSTSGNECH